MDEHRVGPVLRHHDRGGAITEEQGGVVAGCEFKAILVQDGDVGIEKRPTKPHALNLNGETLSLGALDTVVVSILPVGHTLDGLVELNLLWFVEAAVEDATLHVPFHHGGILAYPETSLVGHPALAAQTQEVFAERSVGSDRDGGIDRLVLVVNLLELGDFDPGLIEEDFLRLIQPVPAEANGHFGSSLAAPWLDGADGGGEGEGRESQEAGRETPPEDSDSEFVHLGAVLLSWLPWQRIVPVREGDLLRLLLENLIQHASPGDDLDRPVSRCQQFLVSGDAKLIVDGLGKILDTHTVLFGFASEGVR